MRLIIFRMKFRTKNKYHLLVSVIPVMLIAAGFKVAVHYLGWEIIPAGMSSFFPSILTGIIFLLGFLLAGVVGDYKESERIPNEISASLFAIWQEAEYAHAVSNSKAALNLMSKIKRFIPTLKNDYFLHGNDKLEHLIESFSEDIIEMGKEGVAPNYVIRMKTEVVALKKLINRITVIKNTDFIPSVFISIEVIAIVFLVVYCLLDVDPWWVVLILVSIFSFIIFSILHLIQDMEDPFEYDETHEVKSDEVSPEVLNTLQKEFERG